LNEPQSPQQKLNFLFNALHRRRYVLFLLLAFLAGCLCAGLFLNRQRFGAIGKLNKRYSDQFARATETIINEQLVISN